MLEIFITSLKQLSTTVLFVKKKKIVYIHHEDEWKGLMIEDQI